MVDFVDTPTSAQPATEDALAAVAALRRLADRVEDDAVERAVADGWTWLRIAEALGVTKQAVHQKHARRLKEL